MRLSSPTETPLRSAPFCCGALVLVVGMAVLLNVASSARAATVTLRNNTEMGCSIYLEGLIAVGDAERLDQIIRTRDRSIRPEDRMSPHGGRVCFNSSGGSFPESMRIVDVMLEHAVGAAIPGGAQCKSACALAFMAGTFMHPEGEGVSRTDRVLHPRGYLGFHAPDLVVQDGLYTQQHVNRAYVVALDTIAQIVALQASRAYDFPPQLMLSMLQTEPASFFEVDTVERAGIANVTVAPTSIADVGLDTLSFRICQSYAARVIGDESSSGGRIVYRPWDAGPATLEIEIQGGFGVEHSEYCWIHIWDVNNPVAETDIGGVYLGLVRIGERQAIPVSAYMTHPRTTRLSDLPLGFAPSMTRFRSIARRFFVSYDSCWLPTSRVQVANVERFVNLRRSPSLSSDIVREVPLGERLTLRNRLAPVSTGSSSQGTSCAQVCNQFAQNPDEARGVAMNQCIIDNMIWLEVRDSRGAEGWISRRYLEPTP